MIKPIDLEEIEYQSPVPGPEAATTVGQLTDETKRRLVWFLQWQSHQDGGLKRFAHTLLSAGGDCALGSQTMFKVGFGPNTLFQGKEFEAICQELDFYPHGDVSLLSARRALIQRGEAAYLEDGWNSTLAMAANREFADISKRLDPNNRHYSAASFLYECRRKALSLPTILYRLCTDAKASWEIPFLRNPIGALTASLEAQAQVANNAAAQTRIRTIIEDALNYTYSTRSFGVINGVERISKSISARMWCAANPHKARYINLTAGTTDLLFYGEIADAIGCGAKSGATASELRADIRNTLKNRDIALVFDEGHCLFGLSDKASIKRLEYVRTEFMNRGIPVVLIITPQFAHRLGDVESKTSFNVNQLRGRVARWAQLPPKPTSADVECLCNFCLPGLDAKCSALLTAFALESEYPFAAVRQVAAELAMLVANKKATRYDLPAVKTAINFALFTAQKISETLPRRTAKPRRRQACSEVSPGQMDLAAPAPSTPDAPPQQASCIPSSRVESPIHPKPPQQPSTRHRLILAPSSTPP